MSIEGWQVMSVLLHMGAFLVFFAGAVYSFRQGETFRKAKRELEQLYTEGQKHIANIAHEGNKEVLKWVLRNSTGG